MPYPGLLHPEPLSLWRSTAFPYLHRRCSNTVLPQSLGGSLSPGAHRFVWARWVSLVGMGFDSKHKFAPLTVLLGLLLCPWVWGMSSQLLQRLPSYWGFSDLGRAVSPHSCSSKAQPLLLTLNVGYLLTAACSSKVQSLLLTLDIGYLLMAACSSAMQLPCSSYCE